MFIHNINPTLLHLGPFEVRYYGLVYVIGFILAFLSLEHNRKTKKLNLTQEEVYDYIFYLMIGVILGSRFFEVFFWNPGYYLQNPLKIFAVWEGGMAFHGGLVGSIIVSLYFCKKKKIHFFQLADILSIPAVFALALGRIANFINGELPGTLTNVAWCFKFPHYEGCRHPVQLYSAIKRFFVFGILIMLNKRRHKHGYIFWNMVLLLGIGRFFLDFMRDDSRFLYLSLGQYFSLAMALIAGYILWKNYRK